MVLSMRLSELGLQEYWCEADPTMRGRLSLPVHTGTGASSSAVIYFEHEPGEHHGRHTDSAEEILLVLDGEAEVSAGDERLRLTAGAIALVPAMVPHDVANVGQGAASARLLLERGGGQPVRRGAGPLRRARAHDRSGGGGA